MKRSTRVALSLLVPAMTAFGCGQRAQPPKPHHQDQTATTCDRPPQPGEAEKVPCPPPQTAQNTNTTHRSSYYHGYGARPAFFGPTIHLGGSSTPVHTTSGVTPTPHSTTSGIAHSTAGTSHATHSTSSSHVSSGGFGRIGGAFSGGS